MLDLLNIFKKQTPKLEDGGCMTDINQQLEEAGVFKSLAIAHYNSGMDDMALHRLNEQGGTLGSIPEEDFELLKHGIDTFSFLLPPPVNKKHTLAELAKLIKETYSIDNPKTLAVYDAMIKYGDVEITKKYEYGGDIEPDEAFAVKQLTKIHDYAEAASAMLKDDTKLEAWLQGLVSKSEQMISDVKHSLQADFPSRFVNGGELDEPGKYVKSELLHIGNYARKLIAAIEDEAGGVKLDPWMKANISVVSNYIGVVRHYLEFALDKVTFETGGLPGGFAGRDQEHINTIEVPAYDDMQKTEFATGGEITRYKKGEKFYDEMGNEYIYAYYSKDARGGGHYLKDMKNRGILVFGGEKKLASVYHKTDPTKSVDKKYDGGDVDAPTDGANLRWRDENFMKEEDLPFAEGGKVASVTKRQIEKIYSVAGIVIDKIIRAKLDGGDGWYVYYKGASSVGKASGVPSDFIPDDEDYVDFIRMNLVSARLRAGMPKLGIGELDQILLDAGIPKTKLAEGGTVADEMSMVVQGTVQWADDLPAFEAPVKIIFKIVPPQHYFKRGSSKVGVSDSLVEYYKEKGKKLFVTQPEIKVDKIQYENILDTKEKVWWNPEPSTEVLLDDETKKLIRERLAELNAKLEVSQLADGGEIPATDIEVGAWVSGKHYEPKPIDGELELPTDGNNLRWWDEANQQLPGEVEAKLADGGKIKKSFEDQYTDAVRTLGIEVNPEYKPSKIAKQRLIHYGNLTPSLDKDFKIKLITNAVLGDKEKFVRTIEDNERHKESIAIGWADFENVAKDFLGINLGDLAKEPDKLIDETYGKMRAMLKVKKYADGGKLDGAGKTARVLIISGKNPLSNQLQKLTGDSYGMQSFEDLEINAGVGSGVSLIKHKATGQLFAVFSATYYNQVDKHVIKDDLSYLGKKFGITDFTGNAKKEAGGTAGDSGKYKYSDNGDFVTVTKSTPTGETEWKFAFVSMDDAKDYVSVEEQLGMIDESKLKLKEYKSKFKDNPNADWIRGEYRGDGNNTHTAGVALDLYPSKEQAIREIKHIIVANILKEKAKDKLAEGGKVGAVTIDGIKFENTFDVSDADFRKAITSYFDTGSIRNLTRITARMDLSALQKSLGDKFEPMMKYIKSVYDKNGLYAEGGKVDAELTKPNNAAEIISKIKNDKAILIHWSELMSDSDYAVYKEFAFSSNADIFHKLFGKADHVGKYQFIMERYSWIREFDGSLFLITTAGYKHTVIYLVIPQEKKYSTAEWQSAKASKVNRKKMKDFVQFFMSKYFNGKKEEGGKVDINETLAGGSECVGWMEKYQGMDTSSIDIEAFAGGGSVTGVSRNPKYNPFKKDKTGKYLEMAKASGNVGDFVRYANVRFKAHKDVMLDAIRKMVPFATIDEIKLVGSVENGKTKDGDDIDILVLYSNLNDNKSESDLLNALQGKVGIPYVEGAVDIKAKKSESEMADFAVGGSVSVANKKHLDDLYKQAGSVDAAMQLYAGELEIFGIYFGHKVDPNKKRKWSAAYDYLNKTKHGFVIFVTPKGGGFKPHVWIEGGKFDYENFAESQAKQLRKMRDLYKKVEIIPVTDERAVAAVAKMEEGGILENLQSGEAENPDGDWLEDKFARGGGIHADRTLSFDKADYEKLIGTGKFYADEIGGEHYIHELPKSKTKIKANALGAWANGKLKLSEKEITPLAAWLVEEKYFDGTIDPLYSKGDIVRPIIAGELHEPGEVLSRSRERELGHNMYEVKMYNTVKNDGSWQPHWFMEGILLPIPRNASQTVKFKPIIDAMYEKYKFGQTGGAKIV